MDVHPTLDVAASVAEDGSVVVWSLPSTPGHRVRCLLSDVWMQAMPTGVAFCGGTDQLQLAVVALDEPQLRIYQPIEVDVPETPT